MDLIGFDLSNIDLRDVSLKGADLRKADLSCADLTEANLVNANLSNAYLKNANLNRTQALATNFTQANFTGACLEDWNINSATQLEGVICDYFFLKVGKQNRRPSDPSKYFKSGEFITLFQQELEAVDLIFSEGIDWQAFLTAFQELQIESESGELSIQAIEKKKDGAFVIRVDVPADANKETIEASFWSKYQPLLEAKDKEIKLLSQQTDFYSQQIKFILQENTRLLEIVKTIAEKENTQYDLRGSKFGGGFAGKYYTGDVITEQKQTLAEAAAEIQELIDQLKQSNPDATQVQQQAYVDAAIPPSLKQRFVDALQASGEAAVEEFLDKPYVNVGKAIVKGWLKPE